MPSHGRLIDVLLDLLQATPEMPLTLQTPSDERARKLAAMIEADPGARISIARLSRRAGASLRTVERCFRNETGLSVGEWRRRFRLLHAMSLLEAGAAVGDVAFEVGYGTVSAFSAAFSRQFGTPPSRRSRIRAARRGRDQQSSC